MSQDITALRQHLFNTLQGVKDGKIDIETAKAINEIGKTLVDTARVEVDFLRATGGEESTFLKPKPGADVTEPGLPPGITGVTVHRLR